MKHYIKTATGVSQGYIKFDKIRRRKIKNGVILLLTGLIGGVGQGGGASPIIWMAILLILLDAYRKTQKGAIIVDYVLDLAIPLWIISYVDDNSIVRHFSNNATVSDMLEGMKSNLKEWQKLLQLTGGDLSLGKCQVIIMHWYNEGEWGIPTLTKTKPQDTIEVESIKQYSRPEKLMRLDPNNAERVLGIRLPLTGSMIIEKNYRKKQLKQFCLDLYQSPLSQYEAHSAYQTRYIPIATYPYTVTTFNSNDLEEIQKGSVSLLLPKLGVNRNMPRSVIYGPRALGGRELTNLRIEQPVKNFNTTLGYLRRQGKMGQILYATMRDVQLEVGTTTPFLDLDPNQYLYVTQNTRWRYTWEMIYETKLKLEITKFWTPQSKYHDDKNIMEYAVKDRAYSGENKYKLATINRCRLYQEAIYISDLLTNNEKTVDPGYLDGTKKNCNSEIKFPPVRKPTYLAWREWKSFIFRTFLRGAYKIHPPVTGKQQHTAPQVPYDEIEKLQLLLPSTTSLYETITRVPSELQCLLGNITVPHDNGHLIIGALKEGTLIGASDGSVIQQDNKTWGGHSYSLQAWNTYDGRMNGNGPTPMTNNISSLTTELYGLLTTTLLLMIITKHHNISESKKYSAIIIADNKQAIKLADNYIAPINISETTSPEYDIQHLLHRIKKLTPIDIKYQWVKGHQDETKTGSKIYGPFPRPVQINIEMDHQAKLAAHRSPVAQLKKPIYSTTVMGAFDANNICVNNIYTHILHQTQHRQLYQYLQKKHSWTEAQMETISWPNLKKALSSYPNYQQTKYAQLMHHWQYIGERKDLLHAQNNACPMQCGNKESKLHYLYCTDPAFHLIREKHLHLLQKQMTAIQTYPGIISAICKILRHGYTEWIQDIKRLEGEQSLLYKAIQQQQQLGKHSLPLGYVSVLWETCQQHWIHTTNTTNHHGNWTKNIIVTVHSYTYSIWKERNNILHRHSEKSIQVKTKQNLQARIASLYTRGRANLTNQELQYFKLPVEQRQKKGVENMQLWITLVEAIFRKRGQARQEQIDMWLTNTTPEKNWRDRLKSQSDNTSHLQEGRTRISRP